MGSTSEKTERAFQDCYPDNLSHCYGCGRLMAIPGFIYGGLVASLIDCHGDVVTARGEVVAVEMPATFSR